MNYEEKLNSAGFSLTGKGAPNVRPFESAVRTGQLVFVSGHAARVDGELIHKGIAGADVNVRQAQEAARAAFVNCLKAVKDLTGDLDEIIRIVNIKGYVASTPEFKDQPLVMNSVSDLVNQVFGEAGKHSRAAIGAASLPGGTSVEVELIVEVK
ncbi:MAG: RidA family protein [Lacrimispora celerecrescens]|uniref:RidA family protein n=1 Tax=Lacrimispora indolis TaxID=69825 RepID=UPI0003FD08DC|nr:RidA family protein [[Clostridium] methoxybenzovorans]MBE7721368.1 RidA family protein [Lacrimispora celerecrescens]